MVLDNLGTSLKNTLSKIAGAMFIDDKLLNELVKDIQKALIQADVNVQLVFSLTNTIKDKAKNPPKGLSQKEFLVNVVYETLTEFLGEERKELDVSSTKPLKIMLVGLFGNGKTTTTSKLAKFYKKRGFKVALICTDTWRPAAYEQLKQLGDAIEVPVFGDPNEKDPIKIFQKFNLTPFDIILVDTAGRDALSSDLIEELNTLNKVVQASERLLIISADVGQAAKKQAETFHEACNITGVIITRLDGTAKGGGALTACSSTKAPVRFIGVGEHVDDLEIFDPKRFVGRLLGMGDIETLLEKAKEVMNEEDVKDVGDKFLRGEFTLIDLYQQMEAMKKMGPLGKVAEMIPGFSQIKLPKDALKVQEEKLHKWKFILDSCTKEELENADIVSSSRAERIAKGSGCDISYVRDLLKQYKQSKKMVKMMKGEGSMDKMMKKLSKGQMKFK